LRPAEYNRMFEMEETYWWFVARRKLVCELIDRLAMPAGARLLDVGCGTGANLKAFNKEFERVGIDASDAALEFCHQRGLKSLVRAKIEQSGLEKDDFDVVTALDVLEHVDDDMQALRELRRVSKPGGFILITVPAFGFLWSEHDEALHHRRRYTTAELESKLTAAGFQVVRISYFLATLFLPILFARVAQNLTKRRVEPQATHVILPKWLNSAIVRLLDVEKRLLQWTWRMPFGVSIVALAQKPSVPEAQSKAAVTQAEQEVPAESVAFR
jgi:ubiquinone/menaquinone biosynthesis C-methylase UbiE